MAAARPQPRDTLDKALSYKERCERAGYPVRRVVLEGKRIELVFDGDAPEGSEFDLLDFKR